jgi:molybdopterin-containing oxidoreductase family iron-sulfur binding subunit
MMERRDFLRLIGVTGAGTLTACDAKVGPKQLIPYLVPHEDITPGIPTWYASTCRECPAGCGVHVKTREGRVIKLEGNPDNPINRGKLCGRGQAAHQRLYDPHRLRGPRRRDGEGYEAVGWDEAADAVARGLGESGDALGSVVLVSGLQTGTRDRLYTEWAESVGADRVVYEPFAHEANVEANRRVFGNAAIPSYDIEGAELVISFGADFLETWVSPVRFSAAWAEMHAYRGGEDERARVMDLIEGGMFVAVEPRLSMTASNADEWVSIKPGTEYIVALAMARILGAGGPAAEWTSSRASDATGVSPATIERLAALFRNHRSVALPGGVSTAHARATAAGVAVNLLNQAGGAVGDTVRPGSTVAGAIPGSYRAMSDLADRMRSGSVKAILFSETNPVYSLPSGLGFAEALEQVPFRASLDSVFHETASHCDWLLPDHTPLESWGDWIPEESVTSIVQPAMRPVFDTRATPDVLLDVHRSLAETRPSDGEPGLDSLTAESWYDYLREAWRGRAPDEIAWADLLKAGGRWEDEGAVSEDEGTPQSEVEETAELAYDPIEFDGPEAGLDLIVFPQIAMYDGRGAGSPWLQELPDPATSASWQTWVELHPETAAGMGVRDGDVVAVESSHARLEAPVIVYPGARRDTAAMPLGRGHTRMGDFATGRGPNPVELLPAEVEEASGGFVYQGVRVTVTRTGAWVPPLTHQGSTDQEERGIARAIPMAEALEQAAGERVEEEHHPPGHEPLTVERVARDSDREGPYRWGMAISLDACTGCNACIVACSAENNLPYVGPERVADSRQMSWLRIERYFEEEPDGTIQTRHIPMMCQHCGAAPCEPVCPVYATYHNPEGLNVQVYNRCVGTRYCGNNCPYKVRYFNWYQYEWPEPLHMGLNPDVTVREKGVMEKCSYCVQRINAARIAIKDDGDDAVMPDGYFQTACQQTCPTSAIVFGNLKDPDSRVAKMAGGPLAYSVLEEVNTRPANFYLKQVTDRTGKADASARAEPVGAETDH